MQPNTPTKRRSIHPLADLYVGDSLRVLKTIPTHSVDAVVCDPPYAIKSGPDPLNPYRTTAPESDKLLCNTRKDHPRTTALTVCGSCAIELEVDAFQAATMLGQQSTNWHEKATHSRGYADNNSLLYARWVTLWSRECLRVLKPGGHLVAFGGTKTWHRLAAGIEDAGFDIRDSLAWVYATGTPKSLDVASAVTKHRHQQDTSASTHTNDCTPSSPTTDTLPDVKQAPAWQGWGTALKPAHEPIVLARKPIERTVAANVHRYGTGGLNIDATRLEDGRWPSNLFMDEHQVELLNQTAGQRASRFFWVTKPSQQERVLNRTGPLGVSGVSRVPRGLDLWILVPDTRRKKWDDRATRLSSGARCSTCSRKDAASRRWRTTSI